MRRVLFFFMFSFSSGCGEPKVDPVIAQAVQVESQQQKAAEALVAKEQADREAKARAKRELEERRRGELDDAARLPAELPPDLASACDAVMAAHDEFMKRGDERDVLAWHDGRRKSLGQRRTQCINLGSIQVAACEAEALQQQFPSLSDVPRADAARMVTEHCVEKFGS
jgi:hypothetical protein